MELRTFAIFLFGGIVLPLFILNYLTIIAPSLPRTEPNLENSNNNKNNNNNDDLSLLTLHEMERLRNENTKLQQRIEEMASNPAHTQQQQQQQHQGEGGMVEVENARKNVDKLAAELENTRAEVERLKKEKAVAPNVKVQNQMLLPGVDTLLLDEIPFEDPIDLQDPAHTKLTPFSLHRTPSDGWISRAKQILEDSETRDQLAHSQHHVIDPAQRVTLVTVLLDLKRDSLQNVGQFKRSFNEYIQRFQRTINVNFPMIIFIDASHVSELDLSQNTKGVLIVPFSVKDLEKHFPTYSSRIDEIRHTDLYKRQAQRTGWLQFSPQAALKNYNLLVMSKVFFLRWASQLNPWRTQYHLFVDAGHDCVGALRTSHLNLLRRLMSRVVVTYFDYRTTVHSETHGMPQMAYRKYVGPPHDEEATWAKDVACCKVVRGGIFGGTPAYIDTFARVYNILLSQTLSDGYMGTEENVLGALIYRFPELFNAYHNHDGDNCRLFVDACEKPEADKEIFVHGETLDHWDSESRAFVKSTGEYKPLVVEGKHLRSIGA